MINERVDSNPTSHANKLRDEPEHFEDFLEVPAWTKAKLCVKPSWIRKKGVDETKIDHFANYWILTKSKNQNKSARDPKGYFKDVKDSVMKAAYIDRSLLEYR